MYNSKIEEMEITGDGFFTMDADEWQLFFSTVGMKTWSHMTKLKRWVNECNGGEAKAPSIQPPSQSPHTVARQRSISVGQSDANVDALPDWMISDEGLHDSEPTNCDTHHTGSSAASIPQYGQLHNTMTRTSDNGTKRDVVDSAARYQVSSM